MQRGITSQIIFIITVFLAYANGHAADLDMEKDLQKRLSQSKALIGRAEAKLSAGFSITDEIAELSIHAEEIRLSDLLLQERFRLRQETLVQFGSKAGQRHRDMEAGYLKALTDYLRLIESLQQDSAQQSAVSSQVQTAEILQTLQNLKTLLDKILRKTKRPIFGSLPYKNMNYPAREPDASPAIIPSYRGGNQQTLPDDTKDTSEAPISPEMAALAESLSWNPVSIYEYVKNSIETEWYWGCMKGAAETLQQKSGNDCDQATLLAALLRASGFPTRYIRGTIEFFPDLEKAKNLTGIDDPLKMAEFFRKAGIPSKPVIQGGKIANIQIEHIWIESLIPYANYRGAVIDGHGKTWLGLDTSIKPKGYTFNMPVELSVESAQLSAIRDEYLGSVQALTPLEYFKEKLSAVSAQQSADSYRLTRSLILETMKILPSSLQFDQKKITHEYTELPDELIHKVKLTAFSNQPAVNSSLLFEITLPLYKLSNQQIIMTYEPETVEDQQIIDSYGGLDNTPAYLVRLRPVLKLNDERVVVGIDGLPMGEDYTLTIELISPHGTERIANSHITGNLTAIGIVAQKAISSQLSAFSEEDDAEALLHQEAIRYIDRWNQAEDELASLMHLAISRPIPTVVTVGGVIDVTYLLDMPHGFEWKGVFIDANLRAVSVVPTLAKGGVGGFSDDRQKTFMQLSGLQGSVLEHRIFEDDFQVESISTAKLIQLVSDQQSALSGQLLTIDKTNIAAVLPTLTLDDNIKEDITNAVNQGLIVRIPSADGLALNAISYKDWTGIGYIKENPSTGEAGYMLSGMIAGGMTVAQWIEYQLVSTLKVPYSKKPSNGPAATIAKILPVDRQSGIVGKQLGQQLMVFVQDKQGVPVQGAKVTFRVVAGGGNFGKNALGAPQDKIEVTTGKNGIAKTKYFLGLYTSDNPLYTKLSEKDEFITQIGLNLVTATTGNIGIQPPFNAYGRPDIEGPGKNIIGVFGNQSETLVNSPVGNLVGKVVDRYGNPLSNVDILFRVSPAVSGNP
ncbi:MAG: hypothetical protein HZA15_07475, partial [Nitrospirae bacterium]|nr:hypothetical protein [Nitrospirota bacterium]